MANASINPAPLDVTFKPSPPLFDRSAQHLKFSRNCPANLNIIDGRSANGAATVTYRAAGADRERMVQSSILTLEAGIHSHFLTHSAPVTPQRRFKRSRSFTAKVADSVCSVNRSNKKRTGSCSGEGRSDANNNSADPADSMTSSPTKMTSSSDPTSPSALNNWWGGLFGTQGIIGGCFKFMYKGKSLSTATDPLALLRLRKAAADTGFGAAGATGAAGNVAENEWDIPFESITDLEWVSWSSCLMKCGIRNIVMEV